MPAPPLLLLLACWAPDRDGPAAPGSSTGAWTDEEPPAPAPPPAPPPPFPAWTVRAPASIVGPGGDPLALLERAGVRVEVLQVMPHRVRLRCDGCLPPHQGVEGWLQVEMLWWPERGALPADHPLARTLALRERVASGALALGEAGPAALCALLDAGWQGEPPEFRLGAASLRLEADGTPRLHGPLPAREGPCP